MTSSAIPSILNALVDQAPAALAAALDYEVTVIDGFGASAYEPRDYLMVGVEDPDVSDLAFSGSSQGDWAHAGGTAIDEDGEVVLAALSWNGDGDARTARDRAFAIQDAVLAYITEHYTLGLSHVLWLKPGSSIQLSQQQGDGGATALVAFKVAFRARV